MLRLLLVSTLVCAAYGTLLPGPSAVATLVPGINPNIGGTIQFSRSPFGVLISGTVTGLTPGFHGFHVHEVGNTGGACAAAGPHFNPLMRKHGSPKDFNRHAGDLGNIEADQYGQATIHFVDEHISLDPSSQTYIGNRAVVVHAKEDDLGRGGNADSLSTGNAGGREGCGVIEVLPDSYRERNPYPQPQPPIPTFGSRHGPLSYYFQ
ncbi:LOW QUALITY PROTEIN: superoxide dismutase [Cu-Zn]-like [Macrobrachium nipponense]|uniref:LOW QUALITY PROTEIN: superoxide dismutase [Cu-Zn]-like n=1 Tax=Macrobrachium nipponense TaxID=159736 RepID=UPI0030C8A983